MDVQVTIKVRNGSVSMESSSDDPQHVFAALELARFLQYKKLMAASDNVIVPATAILPITKQ